jgi:hypothetical protein
LFRGFSLLCFQAVFKLAIIPFAHGVGDCTSQRKAGNKQGHTIGGLLLPSIQPHILSGGLARMQLFISRIVKELRFSLAAFAQQT